MDPIDLLRRKYAFGARSALNLLIQLCAFYHDIDLRRCPKSMSRSRREPPYKNSKRMVGRRQLIPETGLSEKSSALPAISIYIKAVG